MPLNKALVAVVLARLPGTRPDDGFDNVIAIAEEPVEEGKDAIAPVPEAGLRFKRRVDTEAAEGAGKGTAVAVEVVVAVVVDVKTLSNAGRIGVGSATPS